MYNTYPRLKIIEAEVGTTEFQTSFKKYVEEHRPALKFFNEYDFDFTDSKDELLVQLADVISGSINKCLIGDDSTNYIEMLKSKILVSSNFPTRNEPY